VTAPLLERDDALARLAGLVAEVRASGDGRLVFVGGEAGVGKTALLHALIAGQEDDVRVLWGACEPLHTPRPLGPLWDVADSTGGALAELVTGGARPHEVSAALLTELRRRAPTVVVLEDLQWADEATLDVVLLLAARIAAVPALVLASYRDDEVERSQQLRFVLGQLARRPARLRLEPLSPAAVAQLAAPHGADAGELHRRTGGNPFFVVEALASGGARIPDTVRDAVLARVAALPAPARAVADAVAVVPGPVELWLLDVLAGDDADGLDACLAAGVLTADRRDVAFRHELARLAVEDAISPRRREALHRAVLAALLHRGPHDADAARLAHHAEACGDTAAVLTWAPRAAAHAAAAGAHREAAAQYARALRCADGLAPGPRADLLQGHADECFFTTDFATAIAAQTAALEQRRAAGDRLGEGDALRSLARLLFFAGRTDEGEERALAAVALLEQLPPGHELAMAYNTVAQRRAVVEDHPAAHAWGERALALARRLGDHEAEAYALTSIGEAHHQAGAVPEAVATLEQARRLAEAHGFDDHAARARAHRVFVPVRERRLAEAAQHIDDALAYAADRGLETWRRYMLAARARVELDAGRWEDAAATARLVIDDPRSAPLARGLALTVLGLVRARRGDAGARGPLDEADVLARDTGEALRIGPAAAARAEAAWLAGDAERVARVTEAALALARRRAVPWVIGELMCWRRQAGVEDDTLPGDRVAEPHRLALAGRWAQAAAWWRDAGCPYEAALALAGGDEPALRESHGQLRAMGATPAAAIVARRLRERGVRAVPRGPRRATRDNPAGLTARELEVLALLVEGLANAEIAQRLVVSRKTVDHHVSAVLRKLGARTRGEASATARRLEIVERRQEAAEKSSSPGAADFFRGL
jgi:DNA-binding CsgD family transcriptional regulator/tetratricopeptide (TPR) repeat protein